MKDSPHKNNYIRTRDFILDGSQIFLTDLLFVKKLQRISAEETQTNTCEEVFLVVSRSVFSQYR